MRYALLLRINDRTYPFRYETAAELNHAIAEVVPNGITLRLGRAQGGSMVLGIKEFDPAIVRNFGLVNYASRIYTVSSTPRWIPAKLISSQRIVDGVIQEGSFDLDPNVPTTVEFDENFPVRTWKESDLNYTIKPEIPTDIVYLKDDPMVRVGVFKFKTPNPKIYKLPAQGEEIVFETQWTFRTPWAFSASCDILDKDHNVVPPTSGRERWLLDLDTEYYIAIRSSSPAADDRITHDTLAFWPYMLGAPSTNCQFPSNNDGSDHESVAGVAATIDLTDNWFSRSGISYFYGATYTVRFTCTKNELCAVTGTGWFAGGVNRIVDLSSEDPIYSRVLAGRSFWQLYEGHTYELTFNRYTSWYDEYRVNAATTIQKSTFVQVDRFTDQPLITRKSASWMDYSAGSGHAQLFPSLDANLRAAKYNGIAFGMTIVSLDYQIYCGYDYYPWMISVFEVDDVLNYMAGGPPPVAIAQKAEGNYNRAQQISSWINSETIEVGKQYVVEIATNRTWTRTTTQLYPTEPNPPTVSKPTDRVNATIDQIEKQIRIPLRMNRIKTTKRG